MNNLTKVLSCSCVLLISLQTPAFSDFADTPGKSSVIVLQGEVTVDGQQRPDLGRSFSDTISGGLLKTKAYTVVDHLSNQPLSQAIEKSQDLAPEQSAVSIGKAAGARWIFVPRMVVEGDFHKLTLKKIRVSDGQVVDVYEAHANGDHTTMFFLIGDSLKQIYAKTARDTSRLGKTSTGEPVPIPEPEGLDPTPVGPSNPTLKLRKAPHVAETKVVSAADHHIHIPDGLRLENGTHVQDKEPEPAAEEPAKIADPAIETEFQNARYMGTISTINPEWRFCILKLRSSRSLTVGDKLSIKTDIIVPTAYTLEVTKIEGRQAVADLLDDTDLETLKVGQSFYQWEPK